MEFQREVWTRKFQHWSTTTRRFLTASIIPFIAECISLALNLPPITIDDIPHMDKIACYTSDLLSAAIYIASENSVSTLTTPSDSLKLLVLTYDDTNHHHFMKKDYP